MSGDHATVRRSRLHALIEALPDRVMVEAEFIQILDELESPLIFVTCSPPGAETVELDLASMPAGPLQ